MFQLSVGVVHKLRLMSDWLSLTLRCGWTTSLCCDQQQLVLLLCAALNMLTSASRVLRGRSHAPPGSLVLKELCSRAEATSD